jgi:hypothetical protein
MIVMVDEEVKIEGFKYKPHYGSGVEGVRFYDEPRSYFSIEQAGDDEHSVDIYFEDIPKLIKALEATQKHYQEGKAGK